jgi:hypothetical protein
MHAVATVATRCVPEKPPAVYSTQRLPIWQPGERRRIADAPPGRIGRKEPQGTFTATTDEHSAYEALICVLFGSSSPGGSHRGESDCWPSWRESCRRPRAGSGALLLPLRGSSAACRRRACPGAHRHCRAR